MVNILLGLTGSVASIKYKELIEGLSQLGEVRVIASKSALHFIDINYFQLADINIKPSKSISAFLPSLYTNKPLLYTDEVEWLWSNRNNPIVHIELRKWADVYIISPISANTLAKISNGIADNLITCVARCWNFNKPCIIVPAMNTYMYLHPITQVHLDTLTKFGIFVIPPISKTLICGDTGIGAMADIDTIIYEVRYAIFKKSQWSWKSIVKVIAITSVAILCSSVGLSIYFSYPKKKVIVENMK